MKYDSAAFAVAKAAYDAARDECSRNKTPENMDAVVAAQHAMEALAPPQKRRGGFACRAGKRQAAERRAARFARR